MTDQGVKVSATPEERASRVANSLRRTWKLNLGFGSNAATEIAAEIRSASEAARKEALIEMAEWHDEQMNKRMFFCSWHLAHQEAARHFRSLSSRWPEQEPAR